MSGCFVRAVTCQEAVGTFARDYRQTNEAELPTTRESGFFKGNQRSRLRDANCFKNIIDPYQNLERTEIGKVVSEITTLTNGRTRRKSEYKLGDHAYASFKHMATNTMIWPTTGRFRRNYSDRV